MSRRSVWVPDDLWARVLAAAAKAGVKEGRPVAINEWVRRSLEAAAAPRKRKRKSDHASARKTKTTHE